MNNNDFQSFIFNKQILTKKKSNHCTTAPDKKPARGVPGSPHRHSSRPQLPAKKIRNKVTTASIYFYTKDPIAKKKKKTTTNQTKTNKIPTFNTDSQITNQINQDLQKQFRNYTERLRGWLNRHRSPYPHVPVRR